MSNTLPDREEKQTMFANGFGQMVPDPVGEILGTGYMRYAVSGVHGLAKIDGQRADILAISATIPGTGQVRRFIKSCKSLYHEIHIWEVWNPLLASALDRWGFVPETEWQDGEDITGFVWMAPLPPIKDD